VLAGDRDRAAPPKRGGSVESAATLQVVKAVAGFPELDELDIPGSDQLGGGIQVMAAGEGNDQHHGG